MALGTLLNWKSFKSKLDSQRRLLHIYWNLTPKDYEWVSWLNSWKKAKKVYKKTGVVINQNGLKREWDWDWEWYWYLWRGRGILVLFEDEGFILVILILPSGTTRWIRIRIICREAERIREYESVKLRTRYFTITHKKEERKERHCDVTENMWCHLTATVGRWFPPFLPMTYCLWKHGWRRKSTKDIPYFDGWHISK